MWPKIWRPWAGLRGHLASFLGGLGGLIWGRLSCPLGWVRFENLFCVIFRAFGPSKNDPKICKTALETVDFCAIFWRAPESQNQSKIAQNLPEKCLQKWLPDRRFLVVNCKIPLRRSIKFGPNFWSQNVVRKIGLQKACLH